jgi:MFS family permease
MFWGWYIVAATVTLMAYNSGMFVYGFTAFINPIAATFGWSYTQITLATSLRGLESGAMSPLLGMIVDRWPSRRLVFIGIILLGIGTLWVSQATNLVMFYIGFMIAGLGGSLGIHMVPQATIVRWFRKDVGKASGIVAMGMGISGAFIPLMVRIIDAYGWQNTLMFLAFGAWILGIPLAFVYRSRPEDYGLLPDGKPRDDSGSDSPAETKDFDIDVRTALRMRAFWQIGTASAIQVGVVMMVVTHVMPYLVSIGIERRTAGTVAMLTPLVSLVARFPFGYLADLFTKRYVMALSIGLKGVGLFFFWLVGRGSMGLLPLFVILFGLGSGGMTPLRTPIIREYFGIKCFGTIFGIASVFNTIAMVASPPLGGWVFDRIGNYQPVWLASSVFALAGVILMITTPPAYEIAE